MFAYYRHIGDYAKKAGHLSTFEHGIYTLLLDRYYDKEEPIPDWQAHRIARCTRDEVEPVLRELFVYNAETECWHLPEADEQIAAYHRRGEISRRNGALGGRPKGAGKKPPEPPEKPTGNPQVKHKKPAGKGQVIKLPPVGKETYSAGFERFWATYPSGKRSKKAEAWKVWQRDQMEEFADAIVKDVEKRRAMHWGWVKEEGKFIPGAQVYLNGRRWTDDIEPIPAQRNAPGRRTAVEQANAERAEGWANGRKP